MDGDIESIIFEFDPNGSLATTHTNQGSDMGLFGGLLGYDIQDKRLVNAEEKIQEGNIDVEMRTAEIGDEHPNKYKLTLQNSEEKHIIKAISKGGGMIEITGIDNFSISIEGDYYETLLWAQESIDEVKDYLSDQIQFDSIISRSSNGSDLIEIKSQQFLEDNFLNRLKDDFNINTIREVSPVLPVLSRRDLDVPFTNTEEMIDYNEDKDLELYELAVEYEKERGDISENEIFNMMKEIIEVMHDSIDKGLDGTEFDDRILGYQSGQYLDKMNDQKLLSGDLLNYITLYTTAMMEIKSSMGVIVAAPTAGACGVLPGAVLGAARAIGASIEEQTKAMLAAGLIGVFIANGSTFSAEVGGCQAECGAASGMAAAALVTLGYGTLNQAINASSIALQNIFGMTCDPVANRVEVPCLGKNVMGASNALISANMALADFDPVIPLDEVITAMDKVGKSIPRELSCTSLGGLSVTSTSKDIEKELEKNKRLK
uniref:L-serine dehydratase, iron-sulfur-dependent, alpha subunit n=1 Tax=uncultured organism TaxID=155900 RepID=M1PWS6_9ZZZZ|nr:L-serine dehydratase, iron-sulfur-dependent, alpha subunit [uncultured organism]